MYFTVTTLLRPCFLSLSLVLSLTRTLRSTAHWSEKSECPIKYPKKRPVKSVNETSGERVREREAWGKERQRLRQGLTSLLHWEVGENLHNPRML